VRQVSLEEFMEDITPRGSVLMEAKNRIMNATTLDEVEEVIEWAWVMLTSMSMSS